MPVNASLVTEVSSSIRIIKDAVEYTWQVGCTPTAVSMVIGYWDRHGYDNLIIGDSSTYSDAVKNAIASTGHYADYYTGTAVDASQTGGTHSDDSIADFLHTSRSAFGLDDGITFYGFQGVGVHGFANYRGYDNFETTGKAWGGFTFSNMTTEIDAGRPVLLDVDSTADGVNDHSIAVFGYNSSTQQLLVHDGWSSTTDMRWIDFKPAAVGQNFGIAYATFVNPHASSPVGQQQFLHLANDGVGSAVTYIGNLNASGALSSTLKTSDNNLSNALTLGLATADGHTSYQLLDDGAGSAALYKILSMGDGEFRYLKLNDDSNLSRATLEFATADGHTFYQLYNDGAGTAALYTAVLQDNGTFTWAVKSADCGLSLKTVGFSTSDGSEFSCFVNDGAGTAARYDAHLLSNGTFSSTLATNDSGVSLTSQAVTEWTPKAPEVQPPAQTSVTVADNPGVTQHLTGTSSNDVFEISGNASDYGWGATEDGTGTVVWKGDTYDVLHDYETISFADVNVDLAHGGIVTPKNVNAEHFVDDIAGLAQFLDGTTGTDVFRVAGSSNTYQWSKAEDGVGTVIWDSRSFDVLHGYEKIAFSDTTIILT